MTKEMKKKIYDAVERTMVAVDEQGRRCYIYDDETHIVIQLYDFRSRYSFDIWRIDKYEGALGRYLINLSPHDPLYTYWTPHDIVKSPSASFEVTVESGEAKRVLLHIFEFLYKRDRRANNKQNILEKQQDIDDAFDEHFEHYKDSDYEVRSYLDDFDKAEAEWDDKLSVLRLVRQEETNYDHNTRNAISYLISSLPGSVKHKKLVAAAMNAINRLQGEDLIYIFAACQDVIKYVKELRSSRRYDLGKYEFSIQPTGTHKKSSTHLVHIEPGFGSDVTKQQISDINNRVDKVYDITYPFRGMPFYCENAKTAMYLIILMISEVYKYDQEWKNRYSYWHLKDYTNNRFDVLKDIAKVKYNNH